MLLRSEAHRCDNVECVVRELSLGQEMNSGLDVSRYGLGLLKFAEEDLHSAAIYFSYALRINSSNPVDCAFVARWCAEMYFSTDDYGAQCGDIDAPRSH